MVIHELDFVKCLSVILVFHVLVMFLIEIGHVQQCKYLNVDRIYIPQTRVAGLPQHVTSLVLEVLSCF